LTVFVSAYAWVGAQATAKKPLGIEDYTRWRSISGQEISGDGKWVTYGMALTNTAPNENKPVLHLLNLDTNQDTEVANGTGGAFSADSKWLAYQVDPTGGGRGGRGARGGGAPQAPATEPGEQQGRGAAATPAQPRRVELRNLETGAIKSWQDIQSFTFAADSSHLILRRRPAAAAGGRGAAAEGGAAGGGGGGGGGAAAPAGPRGVDVVLHNLTTGSG
jgi:hypothetical protein